MKHSTEKLILEQFFPYRLSVSSYRTSRLIASVYQERFGIRIPEWRVIAVLGQHGQATSKEIAEFTAMDKVAVSRAVRALVEKQLAIRKVSKFDARVGNLRLSKAGLKVYEEIVPLALGLEARILEGFGEENVEKLHELFDQLNQRLDELTKS